MMFKLFKSCLFIPFFLFGLVLDVVLPKSVSAYKLVFVQDLLVETLHTNVKMDTYRHLCQYLMVVSNAVLSKYYGG